MSGEPTERPAPSAAEEEPRLIERARAGDLEAYGELVRRYQSKIYGLVYNMTSNREDAEDLVQDVFFKAYKSLDRFHGRSSFFTWVYRIAINQTINFLKKRSRRAGISLNDVDAGVERDPAYVEITAQHSPVRDVSLGELQQKLNIALQNLSEKHRSVVVLHDVQGVPGEEIARMLGCSQGTVRSRLFYARQRMQGDLAEFMK